MSTAVPPSPALTLRPLQEADVVPVVDFATRAQSASVGRSVERTLRAPWSAPSDDRGAVLVDGSGAVVGYATAIRYTREIDGRAHRLCCLGSWYVAPEFRARSLALMLSLLKRPDTTYLSVTPNPTSTRVLTGFRFAMLDEEVVVAPPLLHAATLLAWRGRLALRRDAVLARATPAQRAIVESHWATGCVALLLEVPHRTILVVGKRRTIRGRPVTELLHVEDPVEVRRQFERVKLALMRLDRSMAVSFDPRLLPGAPIRGLRKARPRMYRSDALRAEQIDNLYTEIAV